MALPIIFILILNIGGLIVLVASGVAAVFNQRAGAEDRTRLGAWLRPRAWQMGLLLGFLSLALQYPVYWNGAWSRIYGIPFLVCEVVPGEEPHGPGLPSMALNFLFWLLLPQFVLSVNAGPRRKEGEGPQDRSVSGADEGALRSKL